MDITSMCIDRFIYVILSERGLHSGSALDESRGAKQFLRSSAEALAFPMRTTAKSARRWRRAGMGGRFSVVQIC